MDYEVYCNVNIIFEGIQLKDEATISGRNKTEIIMELFERTF